MKYAKDYSRVIRYGRAPDEDVRGILANVDSDEGYNPNDFNSGVLADKLGDYGDPRELIVRRDLSYRGLDGNKDTWVVKARSHGRQIDKTHNGDFYTDQGYPLADDTEIAVGRTGPNSHFIRWETDQGPYAGHVTNEELQHIQDQLHESGLLHPGHKLL